MHSKKTFHDDFFLCITRKYYANSHVFGVEATSNQRKFDTLLMHNTYFQPSHICPVDQHWRYKDKIRKHERNLPKVAQLRQTAFKRSDHVIHGTCCLICLAGLIHWKQVLFWPSPGAKLSSLTLEKNDRIKLGFRRWAALSSQKQ